MQRIILLATLVLVSTSVFAGLTQPAPVQVTLNPDGSGSAIGDMVTARFSDNDFEFIGCGVRKVSDGAGGHFQFAFCQAEDAENERAFCNTTDVGLIEGYRSVADFSFITFSWNAAGECVSLGTSTQSFYIPDFRDKGPGAGAPGRGR